jgi:hypothetical protein
MLSFCFYLEPGCFLLIIQSYHWGHKVSLSYATGRQLLSPLFHFLEPERSCDKQELDIEPVETQHKSTLQSLGANDALLFPPAEPSARQGLPKDIGDDGSKIELLSVVNFTKVGDLIRIDFAFNGT